MLTLKQTCDCSHPSASIRVLTNEESQRHAAKFLTPAEENVMTHSNIADLRVPFYPNRSQLSGLLGILLLAVPSLLAQNEVSGDPPNRVARISVIQGNVSLEPNGANDFSQAEINYPLTSGDRVYVDNTSLGELQTAGLAVRLGNGADVTLSSLTDNIAQFGLAQGSIRVRTRSLASFNGSQATVEVDTPNGAILVDQPGDVRVDSYPQDDTTVVTVSSGAVEVTGQNLDQQLGPNQSLRLAGSNPVYAEEVQLLPSDGLDQFDQQREQRRERSYAYRYVSPDMIGAADLDDYGDWQQANQDNQGYGAVWYPRGVPSGWTPYSNGHWAWVAPWGWTWVEAEPWGFAPFHYGRWANFGGRWGWVPGPPASAFGGQIRPIYSPALVAFVGGGGGGLSVAIGAIAAWFPLGPREVYQPWYHASPAYCNRVNVTNIYNTNVTEIHNTYINRTVNVYNTTNVTNVTYVNRSVATVVVPQRAFASGQSIAKVQRVQITPQVRSQLAAAPILPHPLVTPATAIVAAKPPARAVPPVQARPVVETRQGFERAGSPGVAVRAPQAPAAVNRPGQPAPAAQAINRAGFPQQRVAQSVAPAPVAHPAAPVSANRPAAEVSPARPAAPAPPVPTRPVQQPEPARVNAAQPAPVHAQIPAPQVPRPAPRPPEQPRPLINKTPPTPVQPPFAEQRRAIQTADPGRPLGPQQVENIRNGRPAGPAQQPEAPHPLPAARPVPAPNKAEPKPNEKEPPRN
jgi:uncharacterized protein DUF6600